MTTPIAHSWNVRSGFPGFVPGRIAAIGGLRWTTNATSGYMGFDAPSGGPYGESGDYYDDSKYMLGKLIEWCTGKTTGASCLIQTYDAYTSAFGTYFRLALTQLGHSYTLTGGIHDWNSYDPLDYDLLISHEDVNDSETFWGYTDAVDKLYHFLHADGKILTALNDGNDSDFQPYGLNAAYIHNGNEQAPMVNSVFAPGETIFAVMRSSANIDDAYDPPDDGTTGFIPCDTHPTGCGDPNGCYVGGWWTR